MPPDIAGEEEMPKGRMPARAKEQKAASTKMGKTPAMKMGMSDKQANDRMPHIAKSHMAAKGKHVDGLAKMAQMGSETRMPVRAAEVEAQEGAEGMPMHMKAPGRVNSGMMKR
jgi:hypothetical protein